MTRRQGDVIAKPPAYSLGELIPIVKRGPRIKRWAVGMTTAPRRTPMIRESLSSLVAAGWPTPRLFAEPGAWIPPEFNHLPITRRDAPLGCWPNYYLALQELLARHPKADAYMIAQDDVLFFPGLGGTTLREHLEEALWPDDDVGCVSLYCSTAYAQTTPGWHRAQRPWVWGACAFVFPRASLVHFLSHNALEWRLTGKCGGMRNIDVVVGQWQTEHEKPIYFASPSICQHVGHTSTLWKNSRATGKRCARDYLGDIISPAST